MNSTPNEAVYTPFWCEENVYQIIRQHSLAGSARTYAVFISNATRSAILFEQQASARGEAEGHYVVWDYHVIVVTVAEDGAVTVLDRDSRLGPMPLPLQEYVYHTFRPEFVSSGAIPPQMSPCFRVVKGAEFLKEFASDRSHMLAKGDPSPEGSTEEPLYFRPAPPYPPIIGFGAKARDETNNLWTHFLNMRTDAEQVDSTVGEEIGSLLTGSKDLLAYPW